MNMEKEKLRQLLEEVQRGRVTIGDALDKLKALPYENLVFARVDNHRALRNGFPEVVFCQGKTEEQVVAVVKALVDSGQTVLATRAGRSVYEAVRAWHDGVEYSETGRVLVIRNGEPVPSGGKVLVITAGTADLPVAEEAAVTAGVMGNDVQRLYDVGVAGIHRLLDHLDALQWAHVIIVVAGMEGALPSVVGGLTDRPVIAVPTSVGYGASFGGLAALLGMLNSCAAGVGVVNIDNGFGAGALASAITSLFRKDTIAAN